MKKITRKEVIELSKDMNWFERFMFRHGLWLVIGIPVSGFILAAVITRSA